MSEGPNRRDTFKTAGRVLAGSCLNNDASAASVMDATVSEHGAVVAARAATSARAGHTVLEKGGNAVDAAVAAALCAAVVEPASCGIAGYGAHLTIALADGTVTCIDANSAAPQAARPNMFEADASAQVRQRANYHGWMAAGVPGTLAGLQLALDRYGTKDFGDVAAPAIRFAKDGVTVNERVADSFVLAPPQLYQDPASKRIYSKSDQPLKVGDTFRNPELAALLERLAERGTVDSFYRGDFGQQIAAEFQKHGGLVTAEDLAGYEAQEVKPVGIAWGDYSIHTAPLTAGGISTLQALLILKAVEWEQLPEANQKHHAALESLRLAWRDRFRYFGDPKHVEVPTARLLSDDYVEQLGRQVKQAVSDRSAIQLELASYEQDGTVHISAGDAHGNLVALTLTHGAGFGACVTVDGLGLTLGHGISRFDPRAGYANSIGPGKRPLNNMTPTIVLRQGRPVLAVGGRGGRRIPNALLAAVLQFVSGDPSARLSIDAPRIHTEGSRKIMLDHSWSSQEAAYFNELGFEVTRGQVAYLSAVAFDPLKARVEAACG